MLLGVIREAGELEPGASSFSVTLEAAALTSEEGRNCLFDTKK